VLIAPPLSIYVHMPWCVAKCPYCDFNSHVAPATLPQVQYVQALLADLDFDLPAVSGREVQSVFFGGGTPSLFAPEFIQQFLAGLRERLTLASDVEITLEANPGTIEHGRFEGYRQVGVNRVSLGVQSFRDAHLKKLGRIHDGDQARQAVSELAAAGVANFNLDLMYGLPEQSLNEALEDLRQAIELRPAHVSQYQLTLEPGTVFYHRAPTLPSDDATWEMQNASQALLAEHGYEQYEVSAYALRDRQCRHNLNYWEFGDYLGLGAGAHGKWTDVAAGEIVRTERRKQPREYLAADAAERLSVRRVVTPEELPFEFALNALRLHGGFDREQFETRTGLSLAAIESPLAQAESRGLLVRTEKYWRASEFGRRFLNDLQACFLPQR
jgi:putative oxygen-independent coproporphyrinogen III oxidase